MRVLLIHLSDMHFDETFYIENEFVESIAKAQKQIKEEFDEILILVTGDIAQSGKEREYFVANIFLGKLVYRIREVLNINKFIQVYVVPGNHDLNYSKDSRDNTDIIKLFYQNNYNQKFLENEFELMGGFLDFAKKHNCYIKRDNFLETKIIDFNGEKIKIIC